MRCSFCFKSQKGNARLICSPADQSPNRAYICAECVEVLHGILEEDRPEGTADRSGQIEELLDGLNRWITKESSGGDATEELASVRDKALQVLRLRGPD